MLWIKSLHIIFMVTWFAGLFYLPRLYVYHASANDAESIERFKIMERKLFYGIVTPGAIFTIGFGTVMLFDYAWESFGQSLWLQIKLALIIALVIYHIMCGKYVADFKKDKNKHSHVYYRWFNEVPVLILVAIILLASVKPF